MVGDVVYEIYRAFNNSGGLAAWIGVLLTLWIVYIATKWRDEARDKTSAEVAHRCLLSVVEFASYVDKQTSRYLEHRAAKRPVDGLYGAWKVQDVLPLRRALERAITEADAHLPGTVDRLREFHALVQRVQIAQRSGRFDEGDAQEFERAVSDLKRALRRAARLYT